MVKITDISTGKTYVAFSANDCLCATDKSVFESVLSVRDVVCMGFTIGEPI